MSRSRSFSSYRASSPPYSEINEAEFKPLNESSSFENCSTTSWNSEEPPRYDGQIPTYDVDHEDPDHSQELIALRAKLKKAKIWLKVTVVLLCATILALVFLHFLSPLEWVGWLPGQDGGPMTPVPQMPLTTVVFKEQSLFAGRPTPQSDDAWNSLLPPGRGFVTVDSPQRKYGLPYGQFTEEGQIYSVAMYHQIHCLGQLRKYTWLLADALILNDTEAGEMMKYMLTTSDGDKHLDHCFDYLRQSIQCAGDMTLEWPRTEASGARFVVEGWGIPHECKNPDAISKWMDKNSFKDSLVTDIAPQ